MARIGLLDAKECDPGLEEAVKTIIYSALRTEVKELHVIRDILIHKFGKDFSKDAIDNVGGIVPQKVVKRLSVEPPSQELVVLYLKEIARAYHAPFSELSDDEASETDSDGENGGTAEKVSVPPLSTDDGELSKSQRLSGNAHLPKPSDSKASISVSGPAPTSDNVRPSIKIPQTKPKPSATNDLDDLKKRFEALRK